MPKTVEGFYQNGQIQFLEPLQEVDERAQVLVTFLEPGGVGRDRIRQLVEQLETIAGLEQGFEELEIRQTRTIDAFAEDMQQKYDALG